MKFGDEEWRVESIFITTAQLFFLCRSYPQTEHYNYKFATAFFFNDTCLILCRKLVSLKTSSLVV